MLIRVANFKGALPKVHPRLLPENYAQIARNIMLNDGTAAPIREPAQVYTFGSAVTSIYKHGPSWLGWSGAVDAAQGPVAQDRLYITGDGVPKLRVDNTEYPLALPAPGTAPTLAAQSATDPNLEESVLYCYTWVTGFSEESLPSPTASVLWSPGVTIQVSGFEAFPAGRNVTSMRIYRSETSAAGITDLYFVAEIPSNTTQYDHDLASAPLNEVIPSLDYDVPRDTLLGIVSMPNGIMAAFDGKELFFCEPYIPHAWPTKYALTTDSEIVGLAVFGSTLAVLTQGTPYLVQGTHPESMVMERVDANMPCLSRRGIVDIGYAALYPSNDGLAIVAPGQSQLISKTLFTRDQWRALSPATFVATGQDGKYIFTFTADQWDTVDGGTPDTVGADTFGNGDPSGFTGTALRYYFGRFDSAFGSRRVGMIDISESPPAFTDFDVITPTAMHLDPITGDIYMLSDDVNVMRWDDEDSAAATMRWVSRLYQMSFPTSFGAAMVQTDEEVTAPDFIACRIYADGEVVGETDAANEPFRLNGDNLAKRWEIEIDGNVAVTGVLLAQTMEELVST